MGPTPGRMHIEAVIWSYVIVSAVTAVCVSAVLLVVAQLVVGVRLRYWQRALDRLRAEKEHQLVAETERWLSRHR